MPVYTEHPSREGSTVNEDKWDAYIEDVRKYVTSGKLDLEEIDYKLELGQQLAAARDAMLSGDQDWLDLVRIALCGNQNILVDWRLRGTLGSWINAHVDRASVALQGIWADDEAGPGERIRRFMSELPQDVLRGKGTRLNPVSVLLMGLGAELYPPYRSSVFGDAFKRTGHGSPATSAEEALVYEHALAFLDVLIDKTREKGLERPKNRLEAQSVVWGVYAYRKPNDGNEDLDVEGQARTQPTKPEPAPNLQSLADELMFDISELRKIEELLNDKRQVIFQGPPGTGKTYAARKLAQYLAAAKDRVVLVQFHPSYAYEDFVQGFRPHLANGQPGFKLRDGPLLQAAKAASDEPDAKHFLIIDEINRGNLAKVFGELYFLLEYRDEAMRLQYSDETFVLPDNLYIIGTMNTADRSIALVDLALRRRFHFVEFHPDKPPINGLLIHWLENNAPSMTWVADVVDRANEKLDDRQAAIGPSYFMKGDLDDRKVDLIWEHNVLPYIEERLYEERERLEEFGLDSLRREIENRGQGDGVIPDDGS